MKTQFTQMLQSFHGQSRHRQVEGQLRKLQGTNTQLEKMLKEKDREIDRLRHQLSNSEARLQELMGTDVLTSLPNRHIFKEHLTHSLKRALRLGYSLSIMLIDIDHLRDINLRHGHEIGDTVLIEVAKILKSSVREIDMPARWGGEEMSYMKQMPKALPSWLSALDIASRLWKLPIPKRVSRSRLRQR
jgi:diguanylate cyclase (GGDEF)-like protein